MYNAMIIDIATKSSYAIAFADEINLNEKLNIDYRFMTWLLAVLFEIWRIVHHILEMSVMTTEMLFNLVVSIMKKGIYETKLQ